MMIVFVDTDITESAVSSSDWPDHRAFVTEKDVTRFLGLHGWDLACVLITRDEAIVLINYWLLVK